MNSVLSKENDFQKGKLPMEKECVFTPKGYCKL
jgi:hypothetical protein